MSLVVKGLRGSEQGVGARMPVSYLSPFELFLLLSCQVLYHDDGSVKGVATVDQGIAKDGSPKVFAISFRFLALLLPPSLPCFSLVPLLAHVCSRHGTSCKGHAVCRGLPWLPRQDPLQQVQTEGKLSAPDLRHWSQGGELAPYHSR